jgi:hypothetical protein
MTVEGYNEEIGGTAISRSIWTWARPAAAPRAELAEVHQFRDVVLLRSALSERFDQD